MRRRLGRFLPIILFALLMQVFAPVGACWAASIAASDPLRSAVICSGSGNANSVDPGNTRHHNHDGCCASCCVTPVGTPVDAPITAIAALERYADYVTWRAYAPDAIAARDTSHAQARAPPTLS